MSEARTAAGAAIIYQLAPITNLAAALSKGIAPERAGRFCGDQHHAIQANHPSWIFGHLCLYPGRVGSLLGIKNASLSTPEPWEDLFGPNSSCVDDADGSVYPPLDELVATFQAVHESVRDVIAAVEEPAFAAPTPVERYRGRFPTVLAAVGFLMGPHAMFHLGQLSTWRRVEGLGSAM
ncbi:MAG: DinB family protein [Planctomycetota bacterium]